MGARWHHCCLPMMPVVVVRTRCHFRHHFGGTGGAIVPSSSWGCSGGSGGTASVSASTCPPQHVMHGVGHCHHIIAAVGITRRGRGQVKWGGLVRVGVWWWWHGWWHWHDVVIVVIDQDVIVARRCHWGGSGDATIPSSHCHCHGASGVTTTAILREDPV